MTTRGEAIKKLQDFQDYYQDEFDRKSGAVDIALSYLEAPIPDTELWENREHIAGLLGPWSEDLEEGCWCRFSVLGSFTSRVRINIHGRYHSENDGALFDTLKEAQQADDVVSLRDGYRFVDDPVTVAPKSKGMLGPWVKVDKYTWERRSGGQAFGRAGDLKAVGYEGYIADSLETRHPTLQEAQAAEDAKLLADGWELEGGPVVPLAEPMAEDIAEFHTRKIAFADEFDELRAKVEKLEANWDKWGEVQENVAAQQAVVSKAVNKLNTHSLSYGTLKSQLLADADFRTRLAKPFKVAGPWKVFDDASLIRENPETGQVVVRIRHFEVVGISASFPEQKSLYKAYDFESAKSWCDDQLRAAGYLLEGGE